MQWISTAVRDINMWKNIWTYLNHNCHEGDVTSPDSKEIDWLTGISKDAKGGLNTSEQPTATENAWTQFSKKLYQHRP